MKEVFEEYGKLLLCIIAILILITTTLAVLSSAGDGALGEWLAQQIRDFLNNVSKQLN